MKTIILTDAQRTALMDALAEVRDTNGRFALEVEADGLTIEATGYVTLDGYVEDNYYNGTGAWIETYREADVVLAGWLYNEVTEDSDEVAIDKDTIRQADRFLNAA